MTEPKPKAKRAVRSTAAKTKKAAKSKQTGSSLDEAEAEAKPKPRTRSRKKKTLDPLEIAERVRTVLLELMCGSENDSVRVRAAQVLMEKLKPREGDDQGGRENEDEEREAALVEARELLASFAEAKLGGAGGAGTVD